MSLWRQITHGLRAVLHPRRRRDELAEEVAHFHAAAAAEFAAQGMSADEARRATQLRSGRADDAANQASEYGWEQGAGRLWASLRFAARQLARHRAFTLTAVATLALGIGANTAVFTVIERVLLEPLPYANAARICAVDTHWSNTGRTTTRVTGPDGVDVRQQMRGLAAVALYGGGRLGVQVSGHAVYTRVTLTDAEITRVFDLHPVAGRVFTASENDRAAMVSEEFARENFGSAQGALHKVISVEDHPLVIVGVLPGWFHFPKQAQVWWDRPLMPDSQSRTAFNYNAVALLEPGVSLTAAQSELDAVSTRLARAYPDANRAKELRLVPLQSALAADARPTLMLLWGAVALMLLIASVNVANLQLTRSIECQREIAVRKALGASQWQTLTPVLLEGILLALCGAVCGLLLAWPAVHVLVEMAPAELPHANSIHMDQWVMAFALILAVATTLAASILPALRAARTDPADALKQDSSRGMGSRNAARLRATMVVGEVAITFVLAVGAGLLLHTMAVLNARDMGFGARSALIADVDVPARTAADYEVALRQLDRIFTAVRVTPGVADAAGVLGPPAGSAGSDGYYQTKGGLPFSPMHRPEADFVVISPKYFSTMEIPLEDGREFTRQDTEAGPPVAIISESLAHQSFGTTNPIGKQIQCGLDSDAWMTVVGVAGDVRQDSAAAAPGPTLYMPLQQHMYYANQIDIVMRTSVQPLSLLPLVQREIRAASPTAAVRFTTLDEMTEQSLAAEHFRAVLVSLFAALAIVLSMLGVYGTLAYTVAQRTFEIGLRMALGADRGVILRGLLRHALLLAVTGIGVGLVLCFALTHVVKSMLVGVQPLDPLSLCIAATLLLVAALAAAFVPGRRATRINPVVALRAE